MFKRKIYDKLLKWKNESRGSTALLIEGARRIGKSTVAETFAKNEYESYVLIDFAFAPESVRSLFNDVTDLDYIFLQLQLLCRVDLKPRQSVIIFDEVQFCPKARQAIKMLVKDGRYDYIETGSLISIKKNVKDILIPSEERRINMYPMDFEEFLCAVGVGETFSLLRKAYEANVPLGEDAHRKIMRLFRLYMLVGGMPQAVSTYMETNNFKMVDNVKRDILNLYEDDFKKIDPTGRAAMLFDAIPAQLNNNASRFQTSGVLANARAKDTAELIAEMQNSGTILVSYHANDPMAGLSANVDLNVYKLFLADTGLFVTLMFKDRDFTENDIYEKLLGDRLPANLGYLYENVTAQMLAAGGDRLFYHTIHNEQSKHNYEVDFLIARQNKICPIEVKSSGYKAHTSLNVFCEKYSGRIHRRYLLTIKERAKDGETLCLPFYFTQFL